MEKRSKSDFPEETRGQTMEKTPGIGKNPVENVSHVPNHIAKAAERI